MGKKKGCRTGNLSEPKIGWLTDLGGFWALELIPGCLVHGLYSLRAEGVLDKEMIRYVGSGWVGLYVNGIPSGPRLLTLGLS